MSKRPPAPIYPAKLRDDGVRLFREHRNGNASDNAAYRSSLRFERISVPGALSAYIERRVLRVDREFMGSDQMVAKLSLVVCGCHMGSI